MSTESTGRRIAAAEAQGWQEVHTCTDDDLPYFDAGEPVGLPPDWKERDISFAVGFRDDDDVPDSRDLASLPDYEHDPAAWGSLLSTELHGYDTDAERGIRCWFYRDEGMRLRHYGPYEVSLPAAVVSCVLVKHGAYSDELRTPE